MTLPTSLERIANALERIADALAPQDVQEAPQDVERQPTLTNPLLAWFASTLDDSGAVGQSIDDGAKVPDGNTAQSPNDHCGRCYEFPGCDMRLDSCHAHPSNQETAQTTWSWLGIVPPAIRGRDKMPRQVIEVKQAPGREPGKPSHCGRCGREGTRRMNNANHCRYCQHEPFWDE